MKTFLLCICCALNSLVLCQNYELLDTRYEGGKYRYRIRLLHLQDSSSYSVAKNTSEFTEFHVLDNEGQALPASITIRSKSAQSSETYYADLEGKFEIELPAGQYETELFEYTHSEIVRLNFFVVDSIGARVEITLGKGPDLYPKLIYSKGKLNPEELDRIVRCLEEEDLQKCSDEFHCVINTEI